MSIQVAKRPSLSQRFEELQEEHTKSHIALASANNACEQLQDEVEQLQRKLGELENLREQVAKLTKELDSAKTSGKWYDERARAAEDELEQAHAVLDGVSGAPSRGYEQEYGKGKRNVVTRLAGAFLAIAQKGV